MEKGKSISPIPVLGLHTRYIWLFFLVAMAITIWIQYKWPIYEMDYLGKLGFPIGSDYRYEETVKRYFGEPIRCWEERGNKYLEYDKFIFCDGGVWGCIKITDESIRFGKDKIGIGSDRSEVEKAYQEIQKLNEDVEWYETNFGVIDGLVKRVWVVYRFDFNNKVEKIDIFDGL